MAQIIKKIKVKKADGTFSEDIPLGIDAEHIYLSDNKTIEEKIDDLDAVAAETLKSKGSCTFAQLPTPAIDTVGNVYNITDNFTTTSSFIEGAGHEYPAGVNVAIIKTGTSTGPNYQYDIIGGMGIPDLSHKEDKVNKVTSLSSNSTNTQYPSAKIVYEQLQRKQDKLKAGTNITIDPDTNTISVTGGGGGGTSSYIDLTNKPQINGIELTGNKTSNELGITIPTKTSDLTNDGPSASIYNSYVATNQPNSALYFSNPNSVTARYGISANSWNNIVLENTINKVTAINTNSTDTEYPSAKAVYNALQNVSGITPITTSSIRIYEMENGIYKIPAGTQIYYSGETAGYTIVINQEGFIEICGSSTFKFWQCFQNGIAHYGNTSAQSGIVRSYSYGNIEYNTNKVTSLSASSTDTQYPSAKAVYDYGQSISNQRNYSTTEHMVGTWIDGKPLYEKTIVGQIDAGDEQGFPLENVETVFMENGFINVNDGYIFPLPYSSDNNFSAVIYLHQDRNYASISISNNLTTAAELFYTVRYTKATDTI